MYELRSSLWEYPSLEDMEHLTKGRHLPEYDEFILGFPTKEDALSGLANQKAKSYFDKGLHHYVLESYYVTDQYGTIIARTDTVPVTVNVEVKFSLSQMFALTNTDMDSLALGNSTSFLDTIAGIIKEEIMNFLLTDSCERAKSEVNILVKDVDKVVITQETIHG